MKRNMFNEDQPEPQDDLIYAFEDNFDDSDGLECEDETIEQAEHLGGWCASVRNANYDEMTIRSFPTREALVAYLDKYGVKLVGA
jgi:hypothetical protein